MQEFKRQPTIKKEISKITLEDIRVSFVGEVLERSPGRMVVGDEMGEIEVVYDDIDAPGSKTVRVVGLVQRPLHVRAEVIQGLSGMNMELYRRASSYLNKGNS